VLCEIIKCTYWRTEGKEVSLHGGPSTLDSTEWEHIPTSSSKLFTPSELESLATLESDRDFHSSAVFAATSPNGHNGFPGTLYLEALFAVLPRASTPDPSAPEYQLGQILIVYRAKLLESGIVSPVNLTQVRLDRQWFRRSDPRWICTALGL
jgi:aldose 1-epimerase